MTEDVKPRCWDVKTFQEHWRKLYTSRVITFQKKRRLHDQERVFFFRLTRNFFFAHSCPRYTDFRMSVALHICNVYSATCKGNLERLQTRQSPNDGCRRPLVNARLCGVSESRRDRRLPPWYLVDRLLSRLFQKSLNSKREIRSTIFMQRTVDKIITLESEFACLLLDKLPKRSSGSVNTSEWLIWMLID